MTCEYLAYCKSGDGSDICQRTPQFCRIKSFHEKYTIPSRKEPEQEVKDQISLNELNRFLLRATSLEDFDLE